TASAIMRKPGTRDAQRKAGLRIKDMVKSNWVYRKLRNFRAGIESGISCLKRAFGLARCVWRGLSHFKAYVWSSAVAYNLALFARLRPLTLAFGRALASPADPRVDRSFGFSALRGGISPRNRPSESKRRCKLMPSVPMQPTPANKNTCL